ncbi:MAG: ADP-ribose pyrophosphatase, partial [Nanohaloarchaea archaeon]|nr:ADP-ribose pyrophosphatase [Candidatus Nanohaloarchaea archaeon]
MELIKEISLKDFGEANNSDSDKTYRLRKASRAIVINDENKIALLFVSEHNYHKLPGGGLEPGEDTSSALR